MGFYLEARKPNGHMFAAKGYAVWDPNIEHIYRSLGLPNPYGEFSGDKTEMEVTEEQLLLAIDYVQNCEFYNQTAPSGLHPILQLMGGGMEQEIDGQREKERTLIFLKACLEKASNEGNVVIYLG